MSFIEDDDLPGDEELKENTRVHLLPQALKDIKEAGIYWNGGISRKQRWVLCALLKEENIEVRMEEVQPHWEHAFFTSKYSYDDILRIAMERAEKSGF